MVEFLPIEGLVGGALIGLAAALLLWGNGRVAGISSIFGGILQRGDVRWRLVFLAGLVTGGLVIRVLAPASFGAPTQESSLLLLLSAFLVGLGTAVGGGCTSGHGVCGLARWSSRSMVAVCTFMATGMITVALMHAFGGGH